MQVAKQLVAVNESIAVLESYGYEVQMQHIRFEEPEVLDSGLWTSGMTIIDFIDAEIDHIYRGFAVCSVHDSFCKVKGAQLAFSRAMTSLSECIGRDAMIEMFNN